MKNSRIILVLFVAFFVTNISFSQDAETKKEIERKKLEAQKKYNAGLLSTKNYEAYLKILKQRQNTAFNLNRTIIFGNLDNLKTAKTNSEIRNINIKIDNKTNMFALNIACKVRLGSLTVEIYDPNGNKQGEFSIENHNTFDINNSDGTETTAYRNPNSEIVEGNISKNINEPIEGNWIVKLIPKRAIARINIQSQLLSY